MNRKNMALNTVYALICPMMWSGGMPIACRLNTVYALICPIRANYACANCSLLLFYTSTLISSMTIARTASTMAWVS